ncbi:hypothetical protein PCYB_122650 [Plasmodium cynomolgi strain B]|uniref:Uncharacterized protein n=1 Tax=Plasmodium cynomolgi (strain B) TaxID=1120755 RepID=K6ULG5_PLACD|nr:hypothetical protein PCYB_122650 [Plasmodium cynomolgi strain B]GAB67698.1 hypothetical protein PCYB_122650 [Plasmodium cynomolgi strain B]
MVYHERRRKAAQCDVKRHNTTSYDEPIPKDPFNPLLLAYEKKKRHRHKYESTSGEEPNPVREERPNKPNPKVDLQHVRKNLWKSKAGGVCIPQISEDAN